MFSGNGGVFVDQDGTLNLQSVASGNDVVLKADNIYSVKNATGQAGRISGTNFAFETAYHYSATGRNFFDICQKWPDGSYIDLVGISNY